MAASPNGPVENGRRTRRAIRLRCPYCLRRFADLDASREHIDAVHRSQEQ